MQSAQDTLKCMKYFMQITHYYAPVGELNFCLGSIPMVVILKVLICKKKKKKIRNLFTSFSHLSNNSWTSSVRKYENFESWKLQHFNTETTA